MMNRSTCHRQSMLLIYLILVSVSPLSAQIPGNSYMDSTGFVEYLAGNYPLVISAPHGGYLKPDSIPDRDCEGCSYLRDSYTQEIARGVFEAFYGQTGYYPHVIINLLHRVKFDANRDIDLAADGTPIVEKAWYGFHEFIDSSKAVVVKHFDRGLFLDFHGHAHDLQRTELGYLLSGTELRKTDTALNTDEYIMESSLQTLVGDNINSLDHSDLLRGPNSFGSLLHRRTFPSVPSHEDPAPKSGESYFSGGYNTVRHGSRDNFGPIDGIQLEFNRDIRFEDDLRPILIDSLVATIVEYISIHYGIIDADQDGYFLNEDCNDQDETINPSAHEIPNNGIDEDCDGNDLITSTDEFLETTIQVYPNPARDVVTIFNFSSANINVELYTINGVKIKSALNPINLSIQDLLPGMYIIKVIDQYTLHSLSKKLWVIR